jgi:CDP-glycerol glycerophosphotransferase
MKLSIITPYKTELKKLADCLTSVRDQKLDFEYEILLVCDHTGDDIESFIKDFYDLPIRLIKLDDFDKDGSRRTGVAAARNVALDEAVGEYVYFLDSDDYLFGDTLAKLFAGLIENEADFAYGIKNWTFYTRDGYIAWLSEQDELANGSATDEAGEEGEGGSEGSDEESDSAESDLDRKSLEESMLLSDDDSDDFIDEYLPTEYVRVERGHRIATKRLVTKRKGLKNISVLNILVRKDFIDENRIRFNEDFRCYSDISFVVEMIEKAHFIAFVPDAVYIKRKHDDPVTYPALSDEQSEDRFDEMLRAYNYALTKCEEGDRVEVALNRKLINYFSGYFMMKMRRSENDYWYGERFDVMKENIEKIDPEVIKPMKLAKRSAVKALDAGDRKAVLGQINRRLAGRKLVRFVTKPHELAKYLYLHKFMNEPLMDNWVMFECFFGKSYGDNPKAIYEYMNRAFPGKYRYIWVIDNPKSKIPYKCTKVKRFSIEYAYYIARCKYFVFNVHQPGFMRKRDGQVFLETWHGTPLKRLAFDMDDNFSSTPGYKKKIFKQAKQWDYLVSDNQYSTDIFRSCFRYDGPMLMYGYPRNDILHAADREERAREIRKKVGIPEGKKTILYAPTFRDDEYYGTGQYKFKLALDLPTMKKELGDEYVLILRTHYYIADKVDVTGMDDFVINLSKYDDIAEIYLISDICITDYSSVFFDYANLRRPILFYTYDLDKYRGMLRGFYFNMEEEVPGPMLFTTEEVADAVKNIDDINNKYKEKYDRFYDKFCYLDHGDASEKIVKDVFKEEGESNQ